MINSHLLAYIPLSVSLLPPSVPFIGKTSAYKLSVAHIKYVPMSYAETLIHVHLDAHMRPRYLLISFTWLQHTEIAVMLMLPEHGLGCGRSLEYDICHRVYQGLF